MKRLAFLLILAPFLTPCLSQANSPESVPVEKLLAMSLDQLLDVEITLATGTPKSLRRAPAAATVITADDIKRMGATTLDEVLATVPGLHVAHSSTALLTPIYSIRGIHAELNPQVLLQYKGSSLQTPIHGRAPLLLRIPVSNISRIEVVRGPGSAVHGADAFAGTINIIPKSATDLAAMEAGFRAGSFNTFSTWFQHGGNYHGWETAASLELQTSSGDLDRIIAGDTQTLFDGLMGTSASLAPGALDTGYKLLDTQLSLSRDKWSFGFWGQLQRDAGPGAGAANALTPDNKLNYKRMIADVSYHDEKITDNVDLALKLSYLYQQFDSFYQIFPAGSILPIGTDGNIGTTPLAGLVQFTDGSYGNPTGLSQTLTFDLTTSYSGIDNHNVRMSAGLAYQHLRTEQYKNNGPGVLDSTTITLLAPPAINLQGPALTDVTDTPFVWLNNRSREIWNLSLQDEWSLSENWELTAGVRYDHYSDFDGTINPRAALVWEARSDLTAKLLYGRAFRPPSFSELYAGNNPSTLGNPALEPETIQMEELIIEYRPRKNLRCQVTLFNYDLDNLIEHIADPAPATTKTSQNARDQDGHGIELEMDWAATDTLRLRANFAMQRSKDESTHQLTPNAPGRQFYVNAHWQFLPYWSLDTQYFWIGDRRRAAGDNRPEIADYDLVNMTLRRENIVNHWDVAVAIRNLFNKDARDPGPTTILGDIPLESRSVWAELRYTH